MFSEAVHRNHLVRDHILLLVGGPSCCKFLCLAVFIFWGRVCEVIGCAQCSHRAVCKGQFCVGNAGRRAHSSSVCRHSEETWRLAGLDREGPGW